MLLINFLKDKHLYGKIQKQEHSSEAVKIIVSDMLQLLSR